MSDKEEGEMVGCRDATHFPYTNEIWWRASGVLIAVQLSVVTTIAFSVQPQGLDSGKRSLQLLNKDASRAPFIHEPIKDSVDCPINTTLYAFSNVIGGLRAAVFFVFLSSW